MLKIIRQKRAIQWNNGSQWDQSKPIFAPKFVALLAFASQGRLEIHLIVVNSQTQLSNVPLHFLVYKACPQSRNKARVSVFIALEVLAIVRRQEKEIKGLY